MLFRKYEPDYLCSMLEERHPLTRNDTRERTDFGVLFANFSDTGDSAAPLGATSP